MRLAIYLLAVASFIATPVFASTLNELAYSNTWLKLLVYEHDSFSPTGYKSAVHSSEFFIAQSGNINPEAELSATLTAMAQPVTATPDQHAKCRFPARLLWLRTQLHDIQELDKDVYCPAYSKWGNSQDIESISLLFANGYLDNPASYYGHLFLKFNHSKDTQHNELIELTVNYGAIIENPVDPLSYILNGIFGGYDGGFSPAEFYFDNTIYGEHEFRDLWEYRLNLPLSAAQLITAHAWEVNRKRYTYYFFHKNCAYRVAELLQIIDNIDLTPSNRPWVIPQAILQRLESTNIDGNPLISKVIYHPSRQTRLYNKYLSLNTFEKNQFIKQVSSQGDFTANEITTLPIQRQQALVDTAIDYYQFILKPNGGGKSSPAYSKALAARYKLPPGEVTTNTIQPNSPSLGRLPSWIQFGATHSPKGNTLSFRFRPAYYDALDSDRSQSKNSALSMGDIQIEANNERIKVRQLDLLSIDSINPAVTGLPKDEGYGWKLRIGWEPNRPSCVDCLIARAQGDLGLGREIVSNYSFASVYAGGALQENKFEDRFGFIRLGTTFLFHLSPVLGVRLSHEQRKSLDLTQGEFGVSSLEMRLSTGRNSDIRTQYEYDGQTIFSIGSGYYF
jgi:hypothetical protein